MVDTFLSQRYPTVEQTLANNSSSLTQQKRLLLANLRALAGSIGYVLIAVAYLRDVSFVPLFLRLMTQMSLGVPTKHLLLRVLSENEKAEQRMFLLSGVVLGALVSVLSHLIYKPYKTSKMGDLQLHGGFTVQFIGERVPYGRWELFMYDVLIFCFQYVYFCLMWTTDDLEVVQSRAADLSADEDAFNNDLLSDGFDGNVFLLSIDLWGCFNQVLTREVSEPGLPQPAEQLASIFLRQFV